METLQILTDMVKELPEMAIWVIIVFFAYKVVFIGSIFGLVRFAIKTLHAIIVSAPTRKTFYRDLKILSDDNGALKNQVVRILGVRSKSKACIHDEDIDWLRGAIDEKIESEKNN